MTTRQVPERELVAAVREIVEGDEFEGVSLADVLGSAIAVSWWAGLYGENSPSRAIADASYFYHFWARGFVERCRTPWASVTKNAWKGRIAIEVLGCEPKMAGFWLPVAKELGPDRCLLVARNRNIWRALPVEFAKVSVDRVRVDWSDCRRWVAPRLGRWRQGLSQACARFGLSETSPSLLVTMLLAQVLRIAQAGRLADAIEPAAYLSTWDQDSVGGPLCAALNRRGVPTYTMVHGAIGRESMPDFLPLVARDVLVWGEHQRRLFLDAGVAGSCIHQVGYQRLSRTDRAPVPEREELLAQLGLAGAGPVLVVGVAVLRTTDRGTWLAALRAFMEALPDGRFLVRLHPSSRKQEYDVQLPAHVAVRVLESSELDVPSTVRLADFVLVDSSTFGFDTLCLGRPVAVLDPYLPAKAQDVMREAVEWGAALYSKDPASLAATICRTMSDENMRRTLAGRAMAFVDDYVCAWGGDAARLIAQAVTRGADRQPHA